MRIKYEPFLSDVILLILGSIKGYIEAGASAVVLSDAIFDKELMRAGKFCEIAELASLATLEALQSVG
jgi:hypothetical protein